MKQEERGKRKELIGTVISNKMNKTVTVEVSRKMRHPKYQKVIERSNKYYAHDGNEADFQTQALARHRSSINWK